MISLKTKCKNFVYSFKIPWLQYQKTFQLLSYLKTTNLPNWQHKFSRDGYSVNNKAAKQKTRLPEAKTTVNKKENHDYF